MTRNKRIAAGIVCILLHVSVAEMMNAIAVEPGKISRTAAWTTLYRAIGALDPDEKLRNNDTFAEKFVPRSAWDSMFPYINFDRGDEFFIQMLKFDVRLGYYYVNARTKHIDAILSSSLTDKVKQVVNLGAGYDSRAYRFHTTAPEVKYFEVDLPEMIADKKERVKQILGGLPEWVSYVPIDFNKQILSEELTKAGYDKNKKTLFIWEGVTMYISKEAVMGTLKFIAGQSPPGSSVVFDYVPKAIADLIKNRREQNEKGIYGWSGMPGEPIIFGIENDKLEAFFDQAGLKLVSDLGPSELSRNYLTRANGRIGGYIAGHTKIAHAVVPGRDQK